MLNAKYKEPVNEWYFKSKIEEILCSFLILKAIAIKKLVQKRQKQMKLTAKNAMFFLAHIIFFASYISMFKTIFDAASDKFSISLPIGLSLQIILFYSLNFAEII